MFKESGFNRYFIERLINTTVVYNETYLQSIDNLATGWVKVDSLLGTINKLTQMIFNRFILIIRLITLSKSQSGRYKMGIGRR